MVYLHQTQYGVSFYICGTEKEANHSGALRDIRAPTPRRAY